MLACFPNILDCNRFATKWIFLKVYSALKKYKLNYKLTAIFVSIP